MQRFKWLALAGALTLPFAAWSHNATLNKDGCHKGKRHADYHCHAGPLKDRSYASEEEAKKAMILEAISPKKKSSAGETHEDRDPS